MRLSPRTALLALVVAALAAWSWWDGRGAQGAAVGPLVPGALEARRVTLARGEASVVLAKDDDGVWRLASAGDFAAYQDGVERLLRQLAGVTTGDLAAESAASHAELGVDDGAVRIVLDAGRELAVGAAAGATYVRALDEARVYRAATLTVPEVSHATWIEAQPFLFDPSVATEIVAVHPDDQQRTLELARATDGRWYADDQRGIAPALVTDWLRAVASLVVEDVVEGDSEFVNSEFSRPCPIRIEGPDGALAHLEFRRGLDGSTSVLEEPCLDQGRFRRRVPSASVERIENGLRALFVATER